MALTSGASAPLFAHVPDLRQSFACRRLSRRLRAARRDAGRRHGALSVAHARRGQGAGVCGASGRERRARRPYASRLRSGFRRCSPPRPTAYEAVKIAGALYLLWLAYRALRHGTALKLKAGAGGGGLRGAFLNGLADQPHESEDRAVLRDLPAAVHRRARRRTRAQNCSRSASASSRSPPSSMRPSSSSPAASSRRPGRTRARCACSTTPSPR